MRSALRVARSCRGASSTASDMSSDPKVQQGISSISWKRHETAIISMDKSCSYSNYIVLVSWELDISQANPAKVAFSCSRFCLDRSTWILCWAAIVSWQQEASHNYAILEHIDLHQSASTNSKLLHSAVKAIAATTTSPPGVGAASVSRPGWSYQAVVLFVFFFERGCKRYI